MQIFHPDLKTKPKKLKVFFKWGVTICSSSHKYNVCLGNLLKVNFLSVELVSSFGFRRTRFVYGEIYHKMKIGFILLKWRNYDKIYTKFKYSKKRKSK